jgi:hypothetical protein
MRMIPIAVSETLAGDGVVRLGSFEYAPTEARYTRQGKTMTQ